LYKQHKKGYKRNYTSAIVTIRKEEKKMQERVVTPNIQVDNLEK